MWDKFAIFQHVYCSTPILPRSPLCCMAKRVNKIESEGLFVLAEIGACVRHYCPVPSPSPLFFSSSSSAANLTYLSAGLDTPDCNLPPSTNIRTGLLCYYYYYRTHTYTHTDRQAGRHTVNTRKRSRAPKSDILAARKKGGGGRTHFLKMPFRVPPPCKIINTNDDVGKHLTFVLMPIYCTDGT